MTYLTPAVVLDTNVVLDWLVFRNRDGAALYDAIESRQVRWLVSEALRGELAHVVGRGVVDAWIDHDHLWESWRLLSQDLPQPLAAGDAMLLRCTDPDDQKFIDLALTNARWLVSRDRAVLKLARRAATLGLQVVTPARWTQA